MTYEVSIFHAWTNVGIGSNLTFQLFHYMKSFKLCRSLELVISDKFNSKHQSSSSNIPNNCKHPYIAQSAMQVMRGCQMYNKQEEGPTKYAYDHIYLLMQLASPSNEIPQHVHSPEAFLFRSLSGQLTLQQYIQDSHQRY